MKKILQIFLIWRVWLFIPILVAGLLIPFRDNSAFTTIWEYTKKYPVVENNLVYPWSNFDGVHYIAIASRGYIEEGRFMPLFPLIIKLVSVPIGYFLPVNPYGSVIFFIALFLSTVFALLAFFYLHKLLSLDFKKTQIEKIILLYLAFPMAFFLATIYTEGLFLLLSVLSLYFARKRNWAVSSLNAMFLSVTRLSGLLIMIPLLYEYYILEIKPNKKLDFKKNVSILWFAIIPILLLMYSYYNFITWGDPLYFVHAHANLGNSRAVSTIVFPLVTVFRYIKILFSVSPKIYEYWIAVVEFLSLVFTSIGLVFVWKQKIRFSYLLYSLLIIALPLFSGTLSGFPRYVLPIFPIFVALSLSLEKHQTTRKVVLVLSFIFQAILLALFARGYYVS